MFAHSKPLPAFAVTLSVVVFLAITLWAPKSVFTQNVSDPERERAFELYDNKQYSEALPLLEKLATTHNADGQVLARLGLSLAMESILTNDVEKRKQIRTRARAIMVRARELGVKNDLMDWAISGIAPDGSDEGGRFSLNKEADQIMRTGEAAFTRNEFDAALKAYERALKLDPRLYEAPLFSGDVYLQQEQWQKAAEWYARAIQINPDRETAYRYWGDALMRQSKLDEARDKYVEAVIIEPYNAYVWRNGLFRWAAEKGVQLGNPKIEPESNLTPMKDNKMTITIRPDSLDKKGDGRSAWIGYAITRAAWSVNNYERFRKAYPAEKDYRHSLKEEADALRMVVEAVKNQMKSGDIKQPNPSLAELVKIHDEGLLEAYILLGRIGAIESLGADYADYVKANRDKLRRYILEYITSGKY